MRRRAQTDRPDRRRKCYPLSSAEGFSNTICALRPFTAASSSLMTPPIAVGPASNTLIQTQDRLAAHAEALAPTTRWCVFLMCTIRAGVTPVAAKVTADLVSPACSAVSRPRLPVSPLY
jgi:hypothetical protein